MTPHHIAELVVAGVVFMIKSLGWCLGQLLSELVGAALWGLVKALHRRVRPPVLTGFEALEKEADERGRVLWAEVVPEARAATPERTEPDPHVLKLSRIPAP